MIIAQRHANALGCVAGPWRIWSLSDGYVELPADLLREATDARSWLAGAHLAWPGIGRIAVDGPGHAVVPVS